MNEINFKFSKKDFNSFERVIKQMYDVVDRLEYCEFREEQQGILDQLIAYAGGYVK